MKRNVTRLLALVLSLIILLTSCTVTPPPVVCDEHFDATGDGHCDFCGEHCGDPTPEDPTPEDPTPDTPGDDDSDDDSVIVELPDYGRVELPAGGAEQETPAITYTWLASIPDYVEGGDFVLVNDSIPSFTKNQLTTSYYEYYSNLDSLGRCGIAVAVLGRETMPAEGEQRGDINSVIPSGWNQKSYSTSLVPTGWIYHRSHLIAWSLSAENDNAKNLITGTQFMNQNCMTEFENMVQDYIKETGNHVLYRVVPYFEGNELVARGVHMEAYSIEDEGEGICYNVFIHNVQKNIIIDYATGLTRHVDEKDTVDTEQPGDYTYILNTNSKKVHIEGCSSANKIGANNKAICTDKTLAQLLLEGYTVCGTCNARPKN